MNSNLKLIAVSSLFLAVVTATFGPLGMFVMLLIGLHQLYALDATGELEPPPGPPPYFAFNFDFVLDSNFSQYVIYWLCALTLSSRTVRGCLFPIDCVLSV
eukprot:SAG11_NODE_1620_length_4569_cov_2.059955_1_plen_101_part_00